jgi:hypothetical protein
VLGAEPAVAPPVGSGLGVGSGGGLEDGGEVVGGFVLGDVVVDAVVLGLGFLVDDDVRDELGVPDRVRVGCAMRFWPEIGP